MAKLRFILLFAGLLCACKETVTVAPSLSLRGDLDGYVHLVSFDTISRSNAGVRVTLEGSGLSTITDDRGHWHFSDLQSGAKTLRIERDSFGYIRIFDYAFVGEGTAYVPDQALYEMSFDPLTVLWLGGYSSEVYGYALAGTEYLTEVRPILEVDTDSTILANEPEYAALCIRPANDLSCKPRNTVRIDQFMTDTIIADFFRPGAPVYARIGLMSNRQWGEGYTQFYDPRVHRTILSGIGAQSNIVRVTTP